MLEKGLETQGTNRYRQLLCLASRHRQIVQHNDMLEVLKPQGCQISSNARAVDLRRQLSQGFKVIIGFVATRHHQHAATHFVERIFQFAALVSGVDVDQHRANARGGKLGEQPFQTVG